MTDIVERLRKRAKGWPDDYWLDRKLDEEAAAEIERLRALCESLADDGERHLKEVERQRRELNLLRAVHENAEAEVRQLIDENGPLIAVCREFIDRWPTEEGIDNTIQRARAILLDHDLRSPPRTCR